MENKTKERLEDLEKFISQEINKIDKRHEYFHRTHEIVISSMARHIKELEKKVRNLQDQLNG